MGAEDGESIPSALQYYTSLETFGALGQAEKAGDAVLKDLLKFFL